MAACIFSSAICLIIQCDGYRAYDLHATGRPITLAACWAHARRKFYEARDYDPAMRQILDLIGCLYGIEERLLNRIEQAGESRPEIIPHDRSQNSGQQYKHLTPAEIER